jgi:addiction module RelE/StbE family toxin
MINQEFEIGLTVRAQKDLREIVRYYETSSSYLIAQKNYDKLVVAMESLGTQPERYPQEPLLVHLGDYRVLRLKKPPYEIFYKITDTMVVIVRIIHSKRDLNRLFKRFKPL